MFKIRWIADRLANAMSLRLTAGSLSSEMRCIVHYLRAVEIEAAQIRLTVLRLASDEREDLLSHLSPYMRATALHALKLRARRREMERELVNYAVRIADEADPVAALKADAETDLKWAMGRFFDHPDPDIVRFLTK
ncbi:MAG: hypothetical protein BGO01_12335 [Armatimonadetes bacterium 55-13]|nr:hypothetical protein [Armatimonadota bacterium]ODU53653.1 MAG: hypothetical protein ABT09_01430 [bacterium SCN 57-13]OJU61701.1 MAG: hypothetical protein BGO01_12335 [Armatimonadetes bacterium 55-13]